MWYKKSSPSTAKLGCQQLKQTLWTVLKSIISRSHIIKWCSPVFVLHESSSKAAKRDGNTNFTPWAESLLMTIRAVSSVASRTYWLPSPKHNSKCGRTWTMYGSNNLPSILQSISNANSAPETADTLCNKNRQWP